MAHDVFICYSSKDKTTADAVCAVLESEGIRCWIAPRDILVGMSYGEAIVDAIHSSKALVLVFSGHANASPQIEREVERAINQRIPVIPLRIEDVAPDKALEYFLSTPHWLDAFTPPLERHLRNLAAQIHRLIVTGDKADAKAAQDAAAALSAASNSPFKTVQTPEPPPAAPSTPPKPEPTPPPRADAAAAAAAAGASAAGGFVPHAATAKPTASPIDFFKRLDTPQKVGIGAAALVVVIGVGWLLSSSGSGPSPTPLVSAPVVSAPGVTIGPNGEVNVDDGKDRVHVGPDGVRVGDGSTPVPVAPSPVPSGSHLPSDGDVIPGRGTTGGVPTGPTTAADQSGSVYNAVTGEDVAGVLTESGYDANVAKDNEGDPMVQGTIQGYKFSIFFYRCNKQQNPETCLDLQFHSSFTNDNNIGNDKLNAYNRDNRFGQAYFMRNGDIGLDMSATLQGGVAREHIKQVIDWWKVTLTGFPKKLTGG